MIHAAVVFIPLLAVGSIVYAAAPGLRRHTRWVVGLLVVVGTGSALLAKLSGDAFRARQIRHGAHGDFLAQIDQHKSYGDATLWAVIVLAVLTALLLVVVKPRGVLSGRRSTGMFVVQVALGVVTIAMSLATLYYVF